MQQDEGTGERDSEIDPSVPPRNKEHVRVIGMLSNVPKTHIELYKRIKENPRLQKKERDYLTAFVADGSQPVFGYPHMCFQDKKFYNIKDIEWQTKKNWNKFTKSILKDQRGKSEVVRVYDLYYE